jgi:hypothetical protein
MSKRVSFCLLGILGLLIVVGLPVLGSWARHRAAENCALDGEPIVAIYQVRIVDAQEQSHKFCCLHCAEIWLSHQTATPRAIWVTDEASGQEIAAADAFFVRSFVETNPATGNRIHTFRTREDAEHHAARFGGRVLEGQDRPLPLAGSETAPRPDTETRS